MFRSSGGSLNNDGWLAVDAAAMVPLAAGLIIVDLLEVALFAVAWSDLDKVFTICLFAEIPGTSMTGFTSGGRVAVDLSVFEKLEPMVLTYRPSWSDFDGKCIGDARRSLRMSEVSHQPSKLFDVSVK